MVLKELIILVKIWVGFWILRNEFSLRNEKCSLEKKNAIVRNTNISLIKIQFLKIGNMFKAL